VLVQTVDEAAETEEFLAAAQDDFVAGVVGWVELTSPSCADDIARLFDVPGGDKLRGIRHQVQSEPDPDWLRRDDVHRGLRVVGAAGLTYDILTFPHQLAAGVAAVRACPDTQFVLDHCSKPYIKTRDVEPWASDIRDLAASPNVVCKLSGLVTEADWNSWTVDDLRPYVDVVLSAFGPERVFFGSDWPVALLAVDYARWVDTVEELTSDLSSDEKAALWSGTARRVYRLDEGTATA
jgi:L-fuconolactonase